MGLGPHDPHVQPPAERFGPSGWVGVTEQPASEVE